MRDRGGLWFGWNGDLVAEESDIAISCTKHGRCTLMTAPLSERDYREFYLGFSNEVLWPIHHYRLDLARFTQEAAEGYRRVNARFADMLAPHLRRTDLIWVHDYHLIPFGADLRARGVGNQIGFFLHIPFPPPDILTAAPEYERLALTLLDYDLVGFQTVADQANFCRFVCEILGGESISPDMVRLDGKYVKAGVFPAGIDVESFVAMAKDLRAAKKIKRYERHGASRLYAIGVDRLDYSKGLPEKFLAFRRLLNPIPTAPNR